MLNQVVGIFEAFVSGRRGGTREVDDRPQSIVQSKVRDLGMRMLLGVSVLMRPDHLNAQALAPASERRTQK